MSVLVECHDVELVVVVGWVVMLVDDNLVAVTVFGCNC